MKLQLKNFSSDKHRITLESKNGYLALHYMTYRKDMGVFWCEKTVTEFGVNDDNYAVKLEKVLKRAEEAIGIELINKKSCTTTTGNKKLPTRMTTKKKTNVSSAEHP